MFSQISEFVWPDCSSVWSLELGTRIMLDGCNNDRIWVSEYHLFLFSRFLCASLNLCLI